MRVRAGARRRVVNGRSANDGYQLVFRVRAIGSPELPTDIGPSGDDVLCVGIFFLCWGGGAGKHEHSKKKSW